MGGARAFDASGAGDGSGADGQGRFDPQTLSVRRCRRSAQPPFKASRSEAEFRVRQGAGRRSDCLRNCIHRSREQTELQNDPLGKACPGVRGLSNSPSSPLSQQGPGAPAHRGAPGARGGHARPSDRFLLWDPAGNTGISHTFQGTHTEGAFCSLI